MLESKYSSLKNPTKNHFNVIIILHVNGTEEYAAMLVVPRPPVVIDTHGT